MLESTKFKVNLIKILGTKTQSLVMVAFKSISK